MLMVQAGPGNGRTTKNKNKINIFVQFTTRVSCMYQCIIYCIHTYMTLGMHTSRAYMYFPKIFRLYTVFLLLLKKCAPHLYHANHKQLKNAVRYVERTFFFFHPFFPAFHKVKVDVCICLSLLYKIKNNLMNFTIQ